MNREPGYNPVHHLTLLRSARRLAVESLHDIDTLIEDAIEAIERRESLEIDEIIDEYQQSVREVEALTGVPHPIRTPSIPTAPPGDFGFAEPTEDEIIGAQVDAQAEREEAEADAQQEAMIARREAEIDEVFDRR